MDKNTPIFFFSGLDRTGKSVTRKAFAQSTSEKYITFERSFLDNIVYDEIFRNIVLDEKTLRESISRFALLGNVYIVRLTLDFNEINRRAKRTEGIEYPLEELIRCFELFDRYFVIAESLGINIITIDCNNKSVNEIVRDIVNEIE